MATDKRKSSVPDWEWLSLVDTDGPFLSKAALKSVYSTGLPSDFDADQRERFNAEFAAWSQGWSSSPDTYAKVRDHWVETVLHELLGWSDELVIAPVAISAQSPNAAVKVDAWAALNGEAATPAALVTVVDRTEDLRAVGTDGWSANAVDRMALLLRETGTTIGVVTDGRWWALVSAAADVTTASGVWDAMLWKEERPSRDAFFWLASFSSIAGGDPAKRLAGLFGESVKSAEQITEALGDQVRRAVELVLQSMSDTHLRALRNGEESSLPSDAAVVYDGAVTVLMRIVFLLFAEERGLLPQHDLYRSAYAIADLRSQLQDEVTEAGSPEALDHSWEAWHRLLAASNAVFHGVSYPDARMPAYGGSLFDPERFPWLQSTDTQGRMQIRVTDRAMLAVLRAVQTIEDGAMQLSFRDLDVEQIGYVYEGLLGYSAEYVTEVVVGLHGKAGFEPEISLRELEGIAAEASNERHFGDTLVAHLKRTQEHSKSRTAGHIAKAYQLDDAAAAANARTRLSHALPNDNKLVGQLEPFHALIRDDLRGFPYVIPAGGIVMTESPQRANTGTHYTPRSLAEEVVLHAIEPLVYSPGPLETDKSDEWVLKSSAEILELKIADIAAGSGAFLVAAARYLADRLIEARDREGAPIGGEEPKRFAVREVVARCLYGADINGMAVEMCKLSLWLISMDPGKPFSFVDDRVFHGNSLLGITTEDQLKAQHIYPMTSVKRHLTGFDISHDLENASRLRRELASGQVDDADRMRSTRTKRALLEQSTRATARLRDVADGIVAAGLIEGGKPGRRLEQQYEKLAEALRDAFREDGTFRNRRQLANLIDAGLKPTVTTGETHWVPIHWILEAPDVLRDRGGFDAIVGNPPFISGTDAPGAMGTNMHDWLAWAIGVGQKGKADIVAFFFLRAWQLLSPAGTFGLIATNTIAQGDTREVGLDLLVARGGNLTRAIRSRAWPSNSAQLDYSAVWGGKRQPAPGASRVLDEKVVSGISTLLEPEGRRTGLPLRLEANRNIAFNGMKIYGTGFVVPEHLARSWIASDARNEEVLFPCLTGEDLNGVPSTSATSWSIDFNNRSLEEAAAYTLPFDHLLLNVKPERDKVNRKSIREAWWKYGDKRPALRYAMKDLDEVLAIAAVSKHGLFARVSSRQVLNHSLSIIATDSYSVEAVLASAPHQVWSAVYGSTLESRLRYNTSDVFETFPMPELTSTLDQLGEALHSGRRAIMLRRNLGLTDLYNLVNAPAVDGDSDVDFIRAIHVQIDEAVIAAYGWTDILLEHGFHTYRQMERWTVSPGARVEVLDRLLEENHRRAAVEATEKPRNVKRGKSLRESEVPEGAMF